jgi:hypothetical protein
MPRALAGLFLKMQTRKRYGPPIPREKDAGKFSTSGVINGYIERKKAEQALVQHIVDGDGIKQRQVVAPEKIPALLDHLAPAIEDYRRRELMRTKSTDAEDIEYLGALVESLEIAAVRLYRTPATKDKRPQDFFPPSISAYLPSEDFAERVATSEWLARLVGRYSAVLQRIKKLSIGPKGGAGQVRSRDILWKATLDAIDKFSRKWPSAKAKVEASIALLKVIDPNIRAPKTGDKTLQRMRTKTGP